MTHPIFSFITVLFMITKLKAEFDFKTVYATDNGLVIAIHFSTQNIQGNLDFLYFLRKSLKLENSFY